MKNQIHPKPDHHILNPAEPRSAAPRPRGGKTSDHRSERRKFREHLRRLDRAFDAEDAIFI